MTRSVVILLACIASLCACKKTPKIDQAAVDKKIIVDYISSHSLKAATTDSVLFYVIDTPGTGLQPKANSDVTVKYKGYLTNGTVFDQSAGFDTNLSQVIAGWTQGIPHFKEGGSGKLLIPSALAYGDQSAGDIPANSVLIFDITLVDVK